MIKKAILTGGGRATRLRPITTTINKHLIPLANKPMIFYAIEKVVEAGVTEIAINLNPGETELQKVVGDGSRWGVKIHYYEQTGGPQGIAHVVNLAKDWAGDEPFIFYLSDNIVLSSIKPLVDRFEKEKLDCLLAFAQVPDPERFGVPQFDSAGKLIDVLEKPADPPSDYAVTGIYIYNSKFFDAFGQIEKSARGEYEISSIHSYFLKNGQSVGYEKIDGWWKDTGKPDDLLIANQLIMDKLPAEEFKNEGEIETGSRVLGKVKIGKGSKISAGTQIFGPVMIGENCLLEACRIGPHTTISSGAEIRSAEIERSIIFENVDIDSKIKIVDSIIGRNTSIVSGHLDKPQTHKMILGDNTFIEM
ncbi:MAG: glucose-1-phosphate thymidylyltransferase [Patescibacteria group bacterium]